MAIIHMPRFPRAAIKSFASKAHFVRRADVHPVRGGWHAANGGFVRIAVVQQAVRCRDAANDRDVEEDNTVTMLEFETFALK